MLSGLILAGGQSTRMGRDKAALRLADGQSFLERQAAVLKAAGASALFASVRPDAACTLEDVARIRDFVHGAGPLAGIAAGLRAAPAGLQLILAVDMPGIEAEHLRILLALASPNCGVVPLIAGHLEPLAAVYPTVLAASAEASLVGGRYGVQAWVRAAAADGHLQLWTAPDSWASAYRSWNTPADLGDARVTWPDSD